MCKLFILLQASLLFLGIAFPCHSEVIDVIIDGHVGKYQFIENASHRWRICAVLPHVNDHFFWAVAAGLEVQAKKAGVDLGISQAGGYEFLEEQRRLINKCMAERADAVLIAAIDPVAFKNELTNLASHGIKVIDLVNGLEGASITAHSHEDFTENGKIAAQYIQKIATAPNYRVAWFPGPANARWSMDVDAAVRKTFSESKTNNFSVKIIEGGWGPTYMDTQVGLVRKLVSSQTVDAVLANAVAAEFAARFYSDKPNKPKIVSTYVNEGVIKEMKKGTIDAMVSGSPKLEARIAIDLAVRSLEKSPIPTLVSIPLRLITQKELNDYNSKDAIVPPDVRIPLPTLP